MPDYYEEDEDQLDLCKCGHDVEDHNDIWKLETKCGKCPCLGWKADIP